VYCAYLAKGKAANSAIGRPTPREAIDCIHSAGGFASIAHPGRIEMDFDEREKLIISLADYGADGIEGVYTTHTEKETAYFIRLAKELSLYVTGGSDTHFEDGTHTIGSPAFTPSNELLKRLSITY
jgi:predicted metal-dependent phosphoesterase TrpH